VERHLAHSPDHLAELAAQFVRDAVTEKPTLTIIFPTGSTPIGLYRLLRADHDAGTFSLARATVFQLDEYVDLPTYPVGSFREFLVTHLGPVIVNDQTTLQTIDPQAGEAWGSHYDELLDQAGGIDLAIVGVGRNGHLAFNEPGTPADIRSHEIVLTPSTLEANFGTVPEAQRPTRAFTVGLWDIARARRVLLLATGAAKAPVLAALRAGRYDPEIPATILIDHPGLTIIADQAATGN
jgi:glucosamine-6-phosphate deaminase